MQFVTTVWAFLLIITLISWLNYRVLAQRFGWYKTKWVKYAYLAVTLVTVLVTGYGWTKRPPFVTQDYDAYPLFVYGAITWLFGQILLFIVLPILMVCYWLLAKKKTASPVQADAHSPQLSRRVLLQKSLGLMPLAALGVSGKGVYDSQTQMVVTRHTLTWADLPSSFKGLKIAQVTDTHLGQYFDLDRLVTVVQLLAREKPDMVVITGDFADDLTMLKPAIGLFNELAPAVPLGSYFCLGNHDYFHNVDYVKSQINCSRIQLLENNHQLVLPGEQPLYLLGVDYPWADQSARGVAVSESRRRQAFAAANTQIPSKGFKILIAHHPDFLFDGFDAQIPLTIAGHTHGGQVVIAGKRLLSPYRYMGGLYTQGSSYGYVGNGTGQWFPFRINCPPEIAIFTLQS